MLNTPAHQRVAGQGVGAVVGAVDNKDVDAGTRQQHGGGSACRTCTDDDDVVASVDSGWDPVRPLGSRGSLCGHCSLLG